MKVNDPVKRDLSQGIPENFAVTTRRTAPVDLDERKTARTSFRGIAVRGKCGSEGNVEAGAASPDGSGGQRVATGVRCRGKEPQERCPAGADLEQKRLIGPAVPGHARRGAVGS